MPLIDYHYSGILLFGDGLEVQWTMTGLWGTGFLRVVHPVDDRVLLFAPLPWESRLATQLTD